MDSSRGKQAAHSDVPEQLLDVFKAAALSVTKLYKTSAKAESRARQDGYQECLEDLLTFLDKQNIGLDDGEGWIIRRWATERFDGQDSGLQGVESEDEVDKLDKTERTSSPEMTRTSIEPQVVPPIPTRTVSPPTAVAPVAEGTPHFVVPTQDTFSFQSSYPNIATLDLSDARQQESGGFPSSRSTKTRFSGGPSRQGPRSSQHLGRGAGTKRRMDFDDFFGGCLNGKETFGNPGKRSRQN